MLSRLSNYVVGSITSRCSRKEPALLPESGEGRPDTREQRKSSLVMWLLITTVISNHHNVRKELLHVGLHTAILALSVYQDSRCWRNTSILSDLTLYLLFICNGRKVFLSRTSPTVNIFVTLQSLSHKRSFHRKPL